MLHEHPEDPAALVVGDGGVAAAVAVDFGHRTLFIHASIGGVTELNFAHERLPRAVAAELPEETRCGEVRHSFTQDIATRCVTRGEDVAPPLVRGFVCHDQERCVLLSTWLGQESNGFAEDDVGREALRVAGKTWELADAELLPRVRPEPFRIPLMRAVERFEHGGNVE